MKARCRQSVGLIHAQAHSRARVCATGPVCCKSNREFYANLSVYEKVELCTCEPGYTGKNCESEYIPCDPSPCLNDGACKQIDNLNYECQCVTGTVPLPSRADPHYR
ncbi:hypothetical protein J6590_019394 [Homalodisca vitripennis]|nr:hypothetical protein J6590_019394 [Homalodisca vitripennis]